MFDEKTLNAFEVHIGRTVFDWKKNKIVGILAEGRAWRMKWI